MPKPYSDDLRERVIEAVEAGASRREAAESFNLCPSDPLDAAARHDLLEILEERYARRSIIVTIQIPVDRWHQLIGEPTYADAIMDRLVNNAHRIDLSGESLRRTKPMQGKKRSAQARLWT
jgi:hypothetical protein